MSAKATARPAPKRLDPETAQRILARLDRAVAELRSVRVTLEHSKAEGRPHGH